jgi:hypothetical protein
MWQLVLENLGLLSGFFWLGDRALRLSALSPVPRLRGFTSLALGILCSYLLWMIFPHIQWLRFLLLSAGLLSWILLHRDRDLRKIVLFTAIAAPFLMKSPISGWDADSIWYFHAKMIHFDREFDFFSSLSRPEVSFSHPAYPKLFPFLAALSSSSQLWNDYSPKLGFLGLLVPLFLLLWNMDLGWKHKLGILVTSFLGMQASPFTSLPEHSLALWCAAGTILLLEGKWRFAGWIALGLAASIKAEGAIYLGSATIFLSLQSLIRNRGLPLKMPSVRELLIPAFAFLPTVLWLVIARLRITSPISEGFAESLISRVSARALEVRPLWNIWGSYFQADRFFWELLAVALLFRSFRTRALLIPAGYFLGLYLVYLSTPYPLAWHLTSSINRTLLPGVLSCYFLGYFMLFKLRTGPEAET